MAVVTAAAIAVGVVGISVADAHGGDTTRIHACTTDAGGRVRLIAADGACQSNERAVDWNIQGAPGPKGDQGVQGEPGPQGEPGGMSGYEIVESTPTVLQPGTGQLQRVSCPAGKVVVGGGGYSADGGSRMDSSFPDVKDGIYRWNAFMRNELTAASITVSVKAVCVDA